MTTPYVIKLGDDDPPMRVILLDAERLPADLTGVTELLVAVRNAGDAEYLLSRAADIVDIGDQAVDSPNRGLVQVLWTAQETYALGPGQKEVEFQALRAGRRVTWPSSGYVPMTVEKDIVPDGS